MATMKSNSLSFSGGLTASNIDNPPDGLAYGLFNNNNLYISLKTGNDSILQVSPAFTGDFFIMRYYKNNAWSNWFKYTGVSL